MTRVACTIVAVACLGSAAGIQSPPAAPLSNALRALVRNERFDTVTSIRGLPLGVRDALQELFGGSLDIAEPGAPFQVTDVVFDRKLPARRLIASGCSRDRCLVYYERGGLSQSFHVALFHWTPAETTFEWGGIAPRGLNNIDGVRSAVLSGAIKAPATSW